MYMRVFIYGIGGEFSTRNLLNYVVQITMSWYDRECAQKNLPQCTLNNYLAG